jgi:hypothetical protein
MNLEMGKLLLILIINLIRVLLAQIVGTLENKKITGINSNARGVQAYMKNIVKSLEILRDKKVFNFN